jgi:hypothetical protein
LCLCREAASARIRFIDKMDKTCFAEGRCECAQDDGECDRGSHLGLYSIGKENIMPARKRDTTGDRVTTESFIEALSNFILFAVFFGVWISTGSFIGALITPFIALIPMAFILIPLGLIMKLIRGI